MAIIGAVSAVNTISSMSGANGLSGISGAGGANGIGGLSGTATTGSPNGGSFLDSLGKAFDSLNGQLTSSDAAMTNFANGSSSADLSTVMLQMQEAQLSLKMGTQARDSMIDAYRQIMQMAV